MKYINIYVCKILALGPKENISHLNIDALKSAAFAIFLCLGMSSAHTCPNQFQGKCASQANLQYVYLNWTLPFSQITKQILIIYKLRLLELFLLGTLNWVFEPRIFRVQLSINQVSISSKCTVENQFPRHACVYVGQRCVSFRPFTEA